MNIINIDHLVLTVNDIKLTCEFYNDILGMKINRFNKERISLLFNKQKINLHQNNNKIKPHAKNATPGSADFCLITKDNINNIKTLIQNKGIKIIKGVVERTGRHGKIQSIYINDPDGNLIEIANY